MAQKEKCSIGNIPGKSACNKARKANKDLECRGCEHIMSSPGRKHETVTQRYVNERKLHRPPPPPVCQSDARGHYNPT